MWCLWIGVVAEAAPEAGDAPLNAIEAELPGDPFFAAQWYLENTGQHDFVVGIDINAAEAWSITRGAGTLLAVVDSGVDVDHPDLAVFDGTDFVDDDGSSDPTNGNHHGTSVAGIAAAVGNNGIGIAGVAHEAELYAIRLIGGPSTVNDAHDAFVEAVDAGADVINNSWVRAESCAGFALEQPLVDALDYAEEAGRDGLGTVVVFSVGNRACDISGDGLLGHPTVIGVGGLDGFDEHEPNSCFGDHVDLAAPSARIGATGLVGTDDGDDNLDGDPDYVAAFAGTSAAAPQVAGVAALMISANPRIRAEDVRRVLCSTAVRVDPVRGDWSPRGHSPLYGCGRLDAGAAVRAVANLGPPETPVVGPFHAPVLHWSVPVDPDGDALTYELQATRISGAESPWSAQLTTDRPRWILPAELEPGDLVEVQVRAVDPWGPGAWTSPRRVRLPAPPMQEPTPSSGCSHLGGSSLPWLLAASALARRRRKDLHRARGTARV
ncbi:MAG: S8 family serine peptidase [Myxococcales bacterium]|nr:S8 family serine peptidase [Myxococcales bacterium]